LSGNHDFDWSNSMVLHNEEHWRKRQIAEMFLLKNFLIILSIYRHTENLNTGYDSLIRSC
ncbi:hypothetical protein X777_04815, partial [Ooceraea biroi]